MRENERERMRMRERGRERDRETDEAAENTKLGSDFHYGRSLAETAGRTGSRR